MRFLLYKGQSQYGSLRLHVDQLATALNRMGHEAVVLDLLAEDWVARLNQIFAKPVQMVFAFNGIGCDIQVQGKSLYDRADTIYATALVDNPVHIWERPEAKIGRYVIATIDRSHRRLLQERFPSGHFAATAFLPPGANLRRPLPDHVFDAWVESRPIGLLFTGTYRGPPQRAWRAWERNAVTRLFDDAADLALAQDMLPLEDAMDEVLAARGIGLSPAARYALTAKSIELHRFLEAQRRHLLLEQLARDGVPATVYGKGWDETRDRFPNLDWRGEGSFEQTLDLLRQTRLVLNSNNNFVDGAHERVFAAQAAGAAVISDTSRWYLEHYQHGRDMLFYRWSALDEVSGTIAAALEDATALADVAKAGWERTMREHSWDVRARSLLELFEMVNILMR